MERTRLQKKGVDGRIIAIMERERQWKNSKEWKGGIPKYTNTPKFCTLSSYKPQLQNLKFPYCIAFLTILHGMEGKKEARKGMEVGGGEEAPPMEKQCKNGIKKR